MSAAFFDLDKTVIAKSSTLAFSRPFYKGGLVNRRAVLKSSYAQFVYLLQGADEDSMDKMRDYLKALCAGWSVQQVHDIVAETLHELIDPLVYAEARRAVRRAPRRRPRGRPRLQHAARRSSGPIGEMLGVDQVIATRMVVEDGCYTGDIAFYAYGENKATAIEELAAAARLGPGRLLRLQRLGDRRPDARRRRPPGRGQPGQAAAQARRRARLAGPGVRQAGPGVAPRAHRLPARPSRTPAIAHRRGARPLAWVLGEARPHPSGDL